MKCRMYFVLLTLTSLVMSARAHHALDLRNAEPIRIEGTIEFISWDGAHVMYQVHTSGARGGSETWAVLGASPKILRSRGIEKATFKVGDRITVTGLVDAHTGQIAPDRFITTNAVEYEMGFYPPAMKKR